MLSENVEMSVEMSFDGKVTDEMIEGLKRDYYLGPYVDIVFGDSSKSASQVADRETPNHE